MDAPSDDFGNRAFKQLAGEVSFGSMPDRSRRSFHRCKDTKIGVAALELFNLPPEDEFVGRAGCVDEENLAGPGRIGQEAQDRHHRRDADAAGNQNDALSIAPGKGKTAEWSCNLNPVAGCDVIVQMA